jgi:hypothetical protein
MTMTELVEKVARALAPYLEGGREYDQMPSDRIALRKWNIQGMCLINDATQDDAKEAAAAAIEAMRPEIEREIADWLDEDATQTEHEARQIVANTRGNARKNAQEWATLVSLKRGISRAVRAGEHRSKP